LPRPRVRPQSRARLPARPGWLTMAATLPRGPSPACAATRPAADRGPWLGGGDERPAPLRGAGQWRTERGAGRVLMPAAPPPYDAGPRPNGQRRRRRRCFLLPRSGAPKRVRPQRPGRSVWYRPRHRSEALTGSADAFECPPRILQAALTTAHCHRQLVARAGHVLWMVIGRWAVGFRAFPLHDRKCMDNARQRGFSLSGCA
jgi:hypothetical protein